MADTNKKYIPEGVFLVCNQGGAPTQLICDPHPINIYSVRYADENDNKPQRNITSFGSCKTMGKCQPPLLLKWTKLKEDVRLHGARPLLEDSECICQIGSGVIKIFFDAHDAAEAAESHNESSFVKDSFSSRLLGGGLLGSVFFPKISEGLGRGVKKGLEGSWNFVSHDVWQGETWAGMGKMALIASAYASPFSAVTGDATLGALGNLFGTDLRQTRDDIVSGVQQAASQSWENVKRGNWGEVAEDVGQVVYALGEGVLGSKGAGLAARGARTGARLAVGAERLAQIGAASSRAMQRLRGASGVVKVGRRVDDVAENAPNTRRLAAGASNAEKGVFGEAMSDDWMSNQGYQKLNGPLVQVGDAPIGRGIDGVWRNPSPPPEYVVTESKFGTSRLGTTKKDGPQMSHPWIRSRLESAVGNRRAADDIISSGYERWILQVDENGNVTRTIMR